MEPLAPGGQQGQVQVTETCSGLPEASTARFSTLKLKNGHSGGERNHHLTSGEVQSHGDFFQGSL